MDRYKILGIFLSSVIHAIVFLLIFAKSGLTIAMVTIMCAILMNIAVYIFVYYCLNRDDIHAGKQLTNHPRISIVYISFL
jgi:hypothetical protein